MQLVVRTTRATIRESRVLPPERLSLSHKVAPEYCILLNVHLIIRTTFRHVRTRYLQIFHRLSPVRTYLPTLWHVHFFGSLYFVFELKAQTQTHRTMTPRVYESCDYLSDSIMLVHVTRMYKLVQLRLLLVKGKCRKSTLPRVLFVREHHVILG